MKSLILFLVIIWGVSFAHAESRLIAFSCDAGTFSALNKFFGEGLVEIDGDSNIARGSFVLSTQGAGYDSNVENLGAHEFEGQYTIIPAGNLTTTELVSIEGFFEGDKNKYFRITLDFKDNFPSHIRLNGTQFRSVCLTK